MKTRQTQIVLTLSLLMLLACALLAQSSQYAGATQNQNAAPTQNQNAPAMDVAVIVNPSNPVDDISTAELRKIFSGDKQHWNTGLPVFVMVRAPQAHERSVMLNMVLRMSESEYKQHWVKKIYSGEVQREPLALLSNGMQLEGVRAERGGIALINATDVRQGVKVLKVDGQLPGAPRYALR